MCILYAKRMYRIILLSVAILALPHFPHYLINGTIDGKKATAHKICVFILFTNLYETFLISRRFQRDIILNVHRSSRTVPVICIRF